MKMYVNRSQISEIPPGPPLTEIPSPPPFFKGGNGGISGECIDTGICLFVSVKARLGRLS